jgi:hypothetical protein
MEGSVRSWPGPTGPPRGGRGGLTGIGGFVASGAGMKSAAHTNLSWYSCVRSVQVAHVLHLCATQQSQRVSSDSIVTFPTGTQLVMAERNSTERMGGKQMTVSYETSSEATKNLTLSILVTDQILNRVLVFIEGSIDRPLCEKNAIIMGWRRRPKKTKPSSVLISAV